MRLNLFAVVILATFLLTSPLSAQERKWTDASGKFSTQAELVGVEDGKVRLKRTDGKIISVPIENLSKDDQKYLADLTRNPVKPAQPWLALKDKDEVSTSSCVGWVRSSQLAKRNVKL